MFILAKTQIISDESAFSVDGILQIITLNIYCYCLHQHLYIESHGQVTFS